MADIRITQGKAWLGASGFGVKLKIFAQAPNSSPVLLEQTPDSSPSNGTLGNGEYAWDHSAQDYHYLYVFTNGIGTYKLWAEHPDNAGVKSSEETYYFDPDNYVGPGDPFDWNGDGIVQNDLVVPAKKFFVSGTVVASNAIDWVHLVVSTSSSCDTTTTNVMVCFTSDCLGTGTQLSFNKRFAFRSNIGTSTFYVYVRDHVCPPTGSQSNVVTLSNVTGSDESYGVGELDIAI